MTFPNISDDDIRISLHWNAVPVMSKQRAVEAKVVPSQRTAQNADKVHWPLTIRMAQFSNTKITRTVPNG